MILKNCRNIFPHMEVFGLNTLLKKQPFSNQKTKMSVRVC